ncbi:MAG: amidohydrolase family protein, partial [Lachnospiraceae bacterium]|nr:amidohydrolase family protein [Lachnospiraceae bacterium]
VKVEGRRAVLEDQPDTIAGSVTNLFDCMRIAVQEMKIPLVDAVRAATLNPARSIGMDQKVGSLLPGRVANVILMSENFEIKQVICCDEHVLAKQPNPHP